MRYAVAILYGTAQWFGEAVIGLFPLLMYELVHGFSTLPIIATCQAQNIAANQTYFGCTKVIETPSPEMCVLAVVASGLALLSVIPVLQRERRPITPFTFVLAVIALVALVTASVFYAFFTGHTERAADTIAFIVLVVALVSSLALSVESAILSA